MLGLLLFTSCGKGKPGDAFQSYADKAVAGHFEELAHDLCRNGKALTLHEDSLNQVIMASYETYLKDKYGGLKRVEVIRDSIYDEGTKADIRARLTFGNDQTEDTEYQMSLVDGTWMIELAL